MAVEIDTIHLHRLVQPNQEVALFSLVATPKYQWNNCNNCGNSTLLKIKNPAQAKKVKKES